MGRAFWLFILSILLVALVSSACVVQRATSGDSSTSTPEATPTATHPPQVTPSPTATATPTPTPSPTPTTAPTNGGATLPDIATIVERVRPAVVSVVATTCTVDIFGFQRCSTGSGTGVIFDAQGHILTNNHVVAGSRGVVVTLDDGRQFPADVVGLDELTDLAVLKIDAPNLPVATIGDSRNMRVGDWVVAIGNALALEGGPSVTVGVVSALGRALEVRVDLKLYDLIQTDALINPGNSGGPLINLKGEVIGINTAILRGQQVEGIGFSIPSDTFLPVSQQLIENGRVRWAYMGVQVEPIDAATAVEMGLPVSRGTLVSFVDPSGPAARGGIRENDVILALDSTVISDDRQFVKVLRFSYKPGDTVNVRVYRNRQEVELSVTLTERPG